MKHHDIPANFPVTHNGDSYDLTKFMRDHPGGTNTLKLFKGKSVTKAMQKYGHGSSAYHILKDFKTDDFCDLSNDNDKGDPEDLAFMEKLEARLDWSKPILNQLHLVAPHYDRWVHTAVHKKCRFFASPVMEAMTYTPWYLVPMFWIPVIVYLAITQFYENMHYGESGATSALSLWQCLYHVAGGLLLWTALEYCLHRWVFHMDPGSSLPMIKIHFLIHGLHHKMPFDSYRQVFPPLAAVLIAVVLYAAISPFVTHPMLKLVGVLTGYLGYDMIHFYLHAGSPKPGSYLYKMKRYHTNHHFVNHDKAYGITNMLWDHIFQTVVSVKKLNFSMNWEY